MCLTQLSFTTYVDPGLAKQIHYANSRARPCQDAISLSVLDFSSFFSSTTIAQKTKNVYIVK